VFPKKYDPRWNQLTMHHPELEELDEEDAEPYRTGSTSPEYTITQVMRNSGITMRLFAQLLQHRLDIVIAPTLREVLPPGVRREASLMPRTEALRELSSADIVGACTACAVPHEVRRAGNPLRLSYSWQFDDEHRRRLRMDCSSLRRAGVRVMLVESLPFELDCCPAARNP
jgi:hypothetical protein